MAWTLENDDLRKEMRRGQATIFYHWPKVAGQNLAAEATAVTATVYDPSGQALETPAVSQSVVGGSLRLAVTVAGIDQLDEDFRVDITFDGHFRSFQFDVVLYPFGEPSVSLNDILEERPGAEEVLTNLGRRLINGGTDAAALAAFAQVVSIRARVDLEAWVREAIVQDRGSGPTTTSSGVRNDLGYKMRPYLILNRERLNRVERMLAMRALYRADMVEPEGPEESSALYRFYDEEAIRAWKQIGPLKYAQNTETLAGSNADEMAGFTRSRSLKRRW